jgi:hypothetical protein
MPSAPLPASHRRLLTPSPFPPRLSSPLVPSQVGGIGGYLDDTATEKNAPEGYVYVFPGDSAPRRVNHDPMHSGGEIASRGGLLPFLADMTTDLQAPEEGYLPLAPGEKYAKKKNLDPLHHGGELQSKGIGGYIGDANAGTAEAGYIASMTSMYAKRAVDESLFRDGSLESGASTRPVGPARPGQLGGVDDD